MDPDSLSSRGFSIVPDVLDAGDPAAQALRAELAVVFDEVVGRAGCRNGLDLPAVRRLLAAPAVRALVAPLLGPHAFAIRATLFDKTPVSNWLVAWHQDRVVPVRSRVDAPGFRAWSEKHGSWFVEPPHSVLCGLLALRIDLDGSDEDNGGLRVLPGTQTHGVLAREHIEQLARTIDPCLCRVPAGGAMLMRPLLLHASSRSTRPRQRRIVHLEFAADNLPGAAEFHWRVPLPTS